MRSALNEQPHFIPGEGRGLEVNLPERPPLTLVDSVPDPEKEQALVEYAAAVRNLKFDEADHLVETDGLPKERVLEINKQAFLDRVKEGWAFYDGEERTARFNLPPEFMVSPEVLDAAKWGLAKSIGKGSMNGYEIKQIIDKWQFPSGILSDSDVVKALKTGLSIMLQEQGFEAAKSITEPLMLRFNADIMDSEAVKQAAIKLCEQKQRDKEFGAAAEIRQYFGIK